MAPPTTKNVLSNSKLSQEQSIINQWFDLLSTLGKIYSSETPRKLQLIDIFIIFSFFLTIIQTFYAFISSLFPYNSFLAGIFCSGGFSVLLICLRLQIANPKDFGNITAESAFAGFIIGNIALFSIVTTFMG